MIKTLKILMLVIFVPLVSFSQEAPSSRYVDKGLLRAQGAFASGNMFGIARGTNLYINGDIEYYVNESVSIRGESFYYLGHFGGAEIFDINHSSFAGAFYHFKTNGQLDPYFGLQPGVAYSRLNAGAANFIPSSENVFNGEGYDFPPTYNPLMALSFGFNYYASRIFHLFAHVKYVNGSHLSNVPSVPLNEVRASFGLGWNLWVNKK